MASGFERTHLGERSRTRAAHSTHESRPAAAEATRPKPAQPILALQRILGNRATADLVDDQRDRESSTAPGAEPPTVVYDVLSRPGAPVDASVRAVMEPRLGADLGAVRLHTDARAQRSAAAVGARAYTVGRDVVFGAPGFNANDPGSVATLAHELTHTVQNRAFAWQGERLELDSPDTDEEREAASAGASVSRELDTARPLGVCGAAEPLLMRHRLAQRLIQRVPTEDPTVVGERAAATALAPRPTGTASQLQKGTEEDVAAARQAGGVEGYHTRLVDPKFDILEQQLKIRAEELAEIKEKGKGVFVYGMWQKFYKDAEQWVQSHMDELEKSRKDESQLVDQFNTWVPQGQAFYDSIVRMALKLNRLGLDDRKDPEDVLDAFSRELWGQLARSDALVKRAGASNRKPAQTPRLDAAVSSLLARMRTSAAKVHAAWLGIQQNLIDARVASITAEAKPDEKRMDEIEEAKRFVREVGHVVDLGLAATGKVDAAVGKAEGVAEKYRAYRLRKGVLKGDIDPDVLPPVEEKEGGGGGETGIPDLSVEGVLGFITDLAYSGEVKELKRRIGMVQSRAQAAGSVRAELQVEKREAEFFAALEALGNDAHDLKLVMAQRREDYERLGEELDELARQDPKARQKHFAPSPGREYFALGLSIVADVREGLATGRSAAAFAAEHLGFPAGFNDRRSAFVRTRQKLPAEFSANLIRPLWFPRQEDMFLRNIGDQLQMFEGKLAHFETMFKDVDAKARELMTTLHPGAELPVKPRPGATGEEPDVGAGAY